MEKPSHFITIKAENIAWLENTLRLVTGYTWTEEWSRFEKKNHKTLQ